MQTYDIVMLIVLAGAIMFGLWRGLAWQIASLASIFLSYFVALRFRGPVSQMIDAEAPWNRLLAMLIIYLATSLVIWIAFGFVRNFISKVKLKEFDRQAGAMLGAANGVILCIIITLFTVTLLDDDKKDVVVSSHSGNLIAKALDRAHDHMPEEVHEVLHPYLVELDEDHHAKFHADETQHEHDDHAADSSFFRTATRALETAGDTPSEIDR